MKDSTFSKKGSLASVVDEYYPHGALSLANLFFGIGSVVGALGLPATHPLTFALAREWGAGFILLAVAIYLQQQQRKKSNDEDDTDDAPTTTTRTTTTTTTTEEDEKGRQRTKDYYHHAHETTAATSPHDVWDYPLWAWRVHWKTFALIGFMVFGNQAGFIVGIKLAGPVTASIWQPSQPIFTAAICMAIGTEPWQSKRVMGIIIAFLGCIAMVVLKEHQLQSDPADADTDDSAGNDDPNANSDNDNNEDHLVEAARYLLGNVLFFGNCLCTSLYVILSKRMLAVYPALLVTAWSYNFASLYMLLATLLSAAWPASQQLFCPECTAGQWHLDPAALPALLYYIVFASVGSYGLLTWANQYATGTLVMSFTVLQPVTAAFLTSVLLMTEQVANCATTTASTTQACLEYPTVGTLCGSLGVIGGLLVIISTEPQGKRRKRLRNDKDDVGQVEMERVALTSIPEDASMSSS